MTEISLIDQLGGYDIANHVVKNAGYKHNYYSPKWDGWHIWSPDDSYISLKDIKSEMLEYRRENSSYDVGDFIIDELLGNSVIKCSEGYKGMPKHYLDNFVRHATDVEIEVGCRL